MFSIDWPFSYFLWDMALPLPFFIDAFSLFAVSVGLLFGPAPLSLTDPPPRTLIVMSLVYGNCLRRRTSCDAMDHVESNTEIYPRDQQRVFRVQSLAIDDSWSPNEYLRTNSIRIILCIHRFSTGLVLWNEMEHIKQNLRYHDRFRLSGNQNCWLATETETRRLFYFFSDEQPHITASPLA